MKGVDVMLVGRSLLGPLLDINPDERDMLLNIAFRWLLHVPILAPASADAYGDADTTVLVLPPQAWL
jgi:hypothetical protein